MSERDWRNRVFKQSVHRALTSPASPEAAHKSQALPATARTIRPKTATFSPPHHLDWTRS